jgi:MFS superfamily sulfate permease-like transporter
MVKEVKRNYYLNLFSSVAEITLNGSKNAIFKWNIRDLQLGSQAEIALVQIIHTNAANNTGFTFRILETFADGYDAYNQTSAIIVYMGLGLNAPTTPTCHKLISNHFKYFGLPANTFTEILASFATIKVGAVFISIFGLLILFSWTKIGETFRFMNALPASLFVVLAGVALNESFAFWAPDLFLGNSKDHMVNLPIFASTSEVWSGLVSPDWSFITNSKLYSIALTLAIVASLESLLSLEATDSLDPLKRISSPDKELLAQGVGNVASGLLGGIPITSVIVRSSTNVYSGAKSRMSGFFHGILLLAAVLALPLYLNKIPLACLASVLLYTGYKLAHPSAFKKVIAEGWKQWVPFLVTVAVVVGVDLLWGIFIGTLVGLIFVILTNYSSVFTVFQNGNEVLIKFQKDVTFLHKMSLKEILRKIPTGSEVYIDTTKVHFMDHDIKQLIDEFIATAHERGIEADLKKK